MYPSLSRWVTAHTVASAFLVLLCSASTRLFMASRNDATELLALYPDAPTYLTPAQSLIDNRAFLDDRGEPEFHRTPGYPAFLSTLRLLVGPQLKTVLIWQALILSFGPLLLYFLGRRLLPPAVALVGAMLAAFSPWNAVLAGVPVSDGLFAVLLIAAFLLLHRTATAGGSRALISAAGVGIVTGIAVLVRPLIPLIVFTPVAVLACAGVKRATGWMLCAIALVCALALPAAWMVRNRTVAQFDGLTDITSQAAWQYLAARVRADVTGQDRHAMSAAASVEETTWGIPVHSQELDRERWKRAVVVFRDHPWRTVYAFGASAFEHTIHPSPDVLTAARLNFAGDSIVLGVWWGVLLALATVALWDRRYAFDDVTGNANDRVLVATFLICIGLTLLSGVSYGAGSRLRAPLDVGVPLLAAAALSRSSRSARVGTVGVTAVFRAGPARGTRA